jgi:hypothetical protein
MNRIITIAVAALALIAVPAAFATGGGPKHGQPKVAICHKAGPKKHVTITVSIAALVAHIAHGDQLGACKTTPRPKPPKPCKIGEGKYTFQKNCPTTPGPDPEDPGEPSEPENPFTGQENRTGWCFQTSNRGWTFINLTSGFTAEEGSAWYDLYLAKATIVVDGHEVTFAGWEDWRADGGIVPAPFVDGIGQTCDNPHVK